MFRFGERSNERLKGVHPDLVKVMQKAIHLSPVDFRITEGLRGIERQRELFRQGKSRTMRSRHLTGHAVDVAALVNGKVSWEWKYYAQIAEAVKTAAHVLDVPVEWGGDWKSLKDGPHFQLPAEKYPGE